MGSFAHFDTALDFLSYLTFEMHQFFQNGSHKYFKRSLEPQNDVITEKILPLAFWSEILSVTTPNVSKLKNLEKMKHPTTQATKCCRVEKQTCECLAIC